MFNRFKILSAIAGAGMLASTAQAFSLNGLREEWMTVDLGYQRDGTLDINEGPMVLGEGYRFNQPFIVYGFDPSYIEFFGAEGVRAAEEAIKIINDLPPASMINPNAYPLSTSRINHTARNLRLLDVKSTMLAQLVFQLGLANPERYAWTLRAVERPTDVVRSFLTVKRNYDPLTLLPSSYVNGTLYTYQIRPIGDDEWDAGEISLDPAEPNISVAGAATGGAFVDDRVIRRSAANGMFFTGLTRDDVGGLRYLYHPGTKLVEQLPTGTSLRSSAQVQAIGGSGGGSGGWNPYHGIGVVVGDTTGGTGGNTNAVAGVVNTGVRGGVDKIQLIRADLDPLLNSYTRPVALRYSDTYSTNGVSGPTRSQNVERLMTRPDITFAAVDRGAVGGGSAFPWLLFAGNGLVDLSALNSRFETAGPGIQDPGAAVLSIQLNRIGMQEVNSNLSDNLTEEEGLTVFVWGSYDGSTNAPIVYPVGRMNLRFLENIVRGAN
jgi:hypothetical protein